MKKVRTLTLDERVAVGHAEGLWRTYDYDHDGLNQLGVPKTDEDLTEKEQKALKTFRRENARRK